MSCNRWEGKRVTGTLSCSLRGGPAGSFNGLKRGMGLGAARGWSAHHFGDAGHRDHEQDPGFAPDASEAAFGCLVFFGILLSIICPNCACLRLFLVLIISLYSVPQGDVCSSAGTATKGPKSGRSHRQPPPRSDDRKRSQGCCS